MEGDLLQYSSGTTGRPKGIKRDLGPGPVPYDEDMVVTFLRAIQMPEGGVYLCPAPLYHSAPIMWSMAVHRMGGTVVVMERFDPRQALRLIQEHHVTHGQFVPTMFVRMLKLAEDERRSYDVSSLNTVVHAAAPCPVEVKRQMIEWWGLKISEYWSFVGSRRVHVHHRSRVAGASRIGGTIHAGLSAHLRRGWRGAPGGPGRHGLGRGDAVVLLPQRRKQGR